jgi:hypothetical protein
MPQLSRAQLEAIIEREMPDYELVPTDEAPTDQRPPSTPADAGGDDIAALRRRYLGQAADVVPATDDEAVNEHDVIVAVRPKRAGGAIDRRARTKTVVISGRDGSVIGSQG